MAHTIALYIGAQKLHELEAQMMKALQEMYDHKQDDSALYFTLAIQATQNLMGKAQNPVFLKGEVMDCDKNYQIENPLMLSFMHGYHLMLALRYEAYDVILEKFYDMPDWFKFAPGHVFNVRCVFYEGLAFAGLALEGKDVNKNHRLAKQKLATIKSWHDGGNPNVGHMAKLLEAEITSMRNVKGASEIYEEAILLSSRGGYVHDKALCHSRAGAYFLKLRQDEYWAAHHYDNAIQSYKDWGAMGVVQHHVEKYRSLLEGFNQCSTVSKGLLSQHFTT